MSNPFPTPDPASLRAVWLNPDDAETFEAECPDCGGHLYWNGVDAFDCGEGCEGSPLTVRDVYLEWNERATTLVDTRGRSFLAHILYSPLPEDD